MIPQKYIEVILFINKHKLRDNYAYNISKRICTFSYITKVIDNLKKKGIVELCSLEDDSRRRCLKLTEKGKVIAKLLNKLEEEWN